MILSNAVVAIFANTGMIAFLFGLIYFDEIVRKKAVQPDRQAELEALYEESQEDEKMEPMIVENAPYKQKTVYRSGEDVIYVQGETVDL
jgi:hypothetical protein